LESADTFIVFPIAFYLEPMLVQPAAAITDGKIIRIVILEAFHGIELSLSPVLPIEHTFFDILSEVKNYMSTR